MSKVPNQGGHRAAGNPIKQAQAAIGKAAAHLRVFHARGTGAEYVSAGHSALARIDEAIGELYRARGILVDEIRADQDERAARVDRLLAENRKPPATDWPNINDQGEAASGPGGAA